MIFFRAIHSESDLSTPFLLVNFVLRIPTSTTKSFNPTVNNQIAPTFLDRLDPPDGMDLSYY